MAECTCGALIANRSMLTCPQCGRSVRLEWFDEKTEPVTRLRTDVTPQRPPLQQPLRRHGLLPDYRELRRGRRSRPAKQAFVGPLRGEIQLIDQMTTAKPASQIAVMIGAKRVFVKQPNRPKNISKSAYKNNSEHINGIAENAAQNIRRMIDDYPSEHSDWRRSGVVGHIALIFASGDRKVYHVLRLRRLDREVHQTWIAEYRLGNREHGCSEQWENCPMRMLSEADWPHWTLIGAISQIIRINERTARSWQFRLHPVKGQMWKLPSPSERIAITSDESSSHARAAAVLKEYARLLISSGWTLENERGENWYSLRFSRTKW